jgi:hypothetical protein
VKTPPSSSLIIHAADADGLPAVVGCPFRVGPQGWKAARATVRWPGGAEAAAQCHPLNRPDSSGVQWVELSFVATRKGTATVVPAAAAAVPNPAMAELREGSATLGNGQVRALLDPRPGRAPLRLERGGETLGELWVEVLTGAGLATSRHALDAREVRVLRAGPLRAQAELEGRLFLPDGSPSFHYRLTAEVWAGLGAARVDWMLAHRVPGAPTIGVRRATLAGEWKVGESARRVFVQSQHGLYSRPRVVANPGDVAIDADFSCGPPHVADPRMLLDDVEYPFYLAPPKVTTEPWLGLAGSRAAACAGALDFCVTRPNRLASAGSRLDFHMIPEGHAFAWPQGWRREQSCAFACGGPGDDGLPRAARRALRALERAPRAQPSREALESCGRFEMSLLLPSSGGRHARLNAILRRLCQLETPGDKWNLGDTVDSGYTRTYAAVPNRLERRPGAEGRAFQFSAGASHFALWPAAAALFIEPVWANNEYDAIHALAQETFRSGSGEHMALLRWMARHTIEVDFLCFSDHRWLHRASVTHSARHTTTGAHPSHFWTQGLLQHYLLTGDRDALEVAVALGDKTIENLREPEVHPLEFTREEGWGLLSLVCLVEATGEARFLKEADRIADFLIGFDRASFGGKVKLSAGREGVSLERQMVDNGFGYASMVEAMDRYQKLTKRKDAAAWLEALLRQLREAARDAIGEGRVPSPAHMVTHMMAIGHERTGEKAFLDVGLVILEHLLDTLRAEEGLGQGIFCREAKPSAMVYRALGRFLGAADRVGRLGPYEYLALRGPGARGGQGRKPRRGR